MDFTNDNGYLPTVVNTNTTMGYTTGVTSGAGVAYPSGAPEITLIFVGFVLLQL